MFAIAVSAVLTEIQFRYTHARVAKKCKTLDISNADAHTPVYEVVDGSGYSELANFSVCAHVFITFANSSRRPKTYRRCQTDVLVNFNPHLTYALQKLRYKYVHVEYFRFYQFVIIWKTILYDLIKYKFDVKIGII